MRCNCFEPIKLDLSLGLVMNKCPKCDLLRREVSEETGGVKEGVMALEAVGGEEELGNKVQA